MLISTWIALITAAQKNTENKNEKGISKQDYLKKDGTQPKTTEKRMKRLELLFIKLHSLAPQYPILSQLKLRRSEAKDTRYFF